MSIGRRGARRFVFLRRQELLNFTRNTLPFLGWAVGEGIRHSAPAHIAGEDGFLSFSRIAVFRFKLLEHPDGGDVIAGFLMEPTLSDAVSVRYPEIAGGFLVK